MSQDVNHRKQITVGGRDLVVAFVALTLALCAILFLLRGVL